MENLPSNRLLQFRPDTFEYIRKEYGLDKPGQMDAAIDALDEWIKKQAHFIKKDFPREYLERTIVLDKGSVERAKTQLDRLFTIKTSLHQLFEKTDVKEEEFVIMRQYYVDALLPKLTKDHYRIYTGKALKDGSKPSTILSSYKIGTKYLDYIRSNDYSSGFVGILDYRDVNTTDLVCQFNLTEMHQFVMCVVEGYQMRVKGVHFLTKSKAIEILVRLLKQALSKKLGDRIFVHLTEESLHQQIPKELLPKEFGGELKSLVELNNDWVEEFCRKENIAYFEEINKAQVNENLRNGKSKLNNDLLGISGSFRTLSVD